MDSDSDPGNQVYLIWKKSIISPKLF